MSAYTAQRRQRRGPRAGLLTLASLGWLVGLTLGASPATASKERTRVELRIIEATPGGNGVQQVDPALKALARDFRSLPFSSFRQHDAHEKVMSPGETITFEFPGPKGERRFLVVASHGEQHGGKLRFQLSIAELRFDTLVAVPDGGTLLVGGPRHGGKTLFFALTAHKSIATRGKTDRKAGR
ncbi:MAG: hypothetical protein ACO3JL_13315 [Myxococcota bacterium]